MRIFPYNRQFADELSDEFRLDIFTVFLIEAFIVSVLSSIFPGWFAKVFLTPINTIKFAPFAILMDDALTFRVWICRHSDNFFE